MIFAFSYGDLVVTVARVRRFVFAPGVPPD